MRRHISYRKNLCKFLIVFSLILEVTSSPCYRQDAFAQRQYKSRFADIYICPKEPYYSVIRNIWRPRIIEVHCPSKTIFLQSNVYRGSSLEDLLNKFNDGRSVWCWTTQLLARDKERNCVTQVSPFEDVYLGLRRENCKVESAARLQFSMPVTLIIGLLLLKYSNKLSTSQLFRVSSVGILSGLGSFIILFLILTRCLTTRRSVASLLASLSGGVLWLLKAVTGYWIPPLQKLLTTPAFISYVLVCSFLGGSLTYVYGGSLENYRLNNVINCVIQFIGVACVYYGLWTSLPVFLVVVSHHYAQLIYRSLEQRTRSQWSQQRRSAMQGSRPGERREKAAAARSGSSGAAGGLPSVSDHPSDEEDEEDEGRGGEDAGESGAGAGAGDLPRHLLRRLLFPLRKKMDVSGRPVVSEGDTTKPNRRASFAKGHSDASFSSVSTRVGQGLNSSTGLTKTVTRASPMPDALPSEVELQGSLGAAGESRRHVGQFRENSENLTLRGGGDGVVTRNGVLPGGAACRREDEEEEGEGPRHLRGRIHIHPIVQSGRALDLRTGAVIKIQSPAYYKLLKEGYVLDLESGYMVLKQD